MKFQNISIHGSKLIYEISKHLHGSKVMLCTRKCDELTNKRNERMNRQASSNMPPTFFKVGGIKRQRSFKAE